MLCAVGDALFFICVCVAGREVWRKERCEKLFFPLFPSLFFLSTRISLPQPNPKQKNSLSLSLFLTLPLVVVQGPHSLRFEHTCSQIQGYCSFSDAKNEQSRYATSGVRPPTPAAAGPNFTWSSSRQYSRCGSQIPSRM